MIGFSSNNWHKKFEVVSQIDFKRVPISPEKPTLPEAAYAHRLTIPR